MGRGLILRCKLACRGLLLPQPLSRPWSYAVLALLSEGYPPPEGTITHVLLTRAPLYRGRSPFSCDLHVLGAPLTFVLSQDQTLQLNLVSPRGAAASRLLGCEALAGARALALEIGESLRPCSAAKCSGARPRALLGPTRRRLHALHAARDTLKASVRFSFQGPRERRDSLVGGETLVALPDPSSELVTFLKPSGSAFLWRTTWPIWPRRAHRLRASKREEGTIGSAPAELR